MKIIDFRVRPPYGGYLKDFLYTGIDVIESTISPSYANATISPAAKQKSMELLLKEMDELNVEKAVVPIRRAKNPDSTNEDLVNLMNEYPDRFITMAGIDPFLSPLEEIDKYVLNGPCQGILLEPSIFLPEALYANDKRLYPIYEKCQENNIPVAMTFGGLGAPNLSYYKPEVIEQVILDFPKMKVAVCHGGWPWVQAICAIAFERGNLYICPDIYMRKMVGYQEYINAANYMLSDKIIYGTTYPLTSMADGIESHTTYGIRKEVLPKIMHDNALKFLNLM